MRAHLTLLGLLVVSAGIAGCASPRGRSDDGDHRDSRRVAVVYGLHSPESALYDAERDVWYVSNILLYGSGRDDNGYIVEIDAGDPRRSRLLVQGGRDGVRLDAPKGMALAGDTIWVTDIDVVRAFHRVTGAPLATLSLAGHRPTLLNDLARGPSGELRFTDTGILMIPQGVVYDTTGDRVFTATSHGLSSTPAGAPYPKPNGIAWDSAGSRWVVATFAAFRSVLYALGDDGSRTPLAQGHGRWDGVAPLRDGRILVSSWSDSTIYALHRDSLTPIVRRVAAPGDIGVDTRRGRVAVPLVQEGRLEIWTIPRID